jgi:flagellar basal body P-ring protein FlgI
VSDLAKEIQYHLDKNDRPVVIETTAEYTVDYFDGNAPAEPTKVIINEVDGTIIRGSVGGVYIEEFDVSDESDLEYISEIYVVPTSKVTIYPETEIPF